MHIFSFLSFLRNQRNLPWMPFFRGVTNGLLKIPPRNSWKIKLFVNKYYSLCMNATVRESLLQNAISNPPRPPAPYQPCLPVGESFLQKKISLPQPVTNMVFIERVFLHSQICVKLLKPFSLGVSFLRNRWNGKLCNLFCLHVFTVMSTWTIWNNENFKLYPRFKEAGQS